MQFDEDLLEICAAYGHNELKLFQPLGRWGSHHRGVYRNEKAELFLVKERPPYQTEPRAHARRLAQAMLHDSGARVARLCRTLRGKTGVITQDGRSFEMQNYITSEGATMDWEHVPRNISDFQRHLANLPERLLRELDAKCYDMYQPFRFGSYNRVLSYIEAVEGVTPLVREISLLLESLDECISWHRLAFGGIHGDCQRANVISTGGLFSFVDLDDLRVAPLLYDFAWIASVDGFFQQPINEASGSLSRSCDLGFIGKLGSQIDADIAVGCDVSQQLHVLTALLLPSAYTNITGLDEGVMGNRTSIADDCRRLITYMTEIRSAFI